MSNIQIIDRVTMILQSFTSSKYEMGISELAVETSLSKSTVHRLALAMTSSGLLNYDESAKKFRPGAMFLHMANVVKTNLSLLKVCKPYMTKLRDTTQETVMLKVVDNDAAVAVECIETEANLRLTTQPGLRYLLYTGASSKVLLAYMEDQEIKSVLKDGIQKLTDNTPSYDEVLRQIEEIRKNGYAVSIGERVDDGVGVSVPIFDSSQMNVASLSLIAPSHRLTKEKIDNVLPALIDVGKTISIELGFNPKSKIKFGKKTLQELLSSKEI